MAEWLRRLIRNQMGSPREGSNPTRSDWVVYDNTFIILILNHMVPVARENIFREFLSDLFCNLFRRILFVIFAYLSDFCDFSIFFYFIWIFP